MLSWGLEARLDTVALAFYAVVLAVAGAVVVSRHRGHPIGWLFLVLALFGAIATDLAQAWGLRATQRNWPGAALGDWMTAASVVIVSGGWILVFLLFPDGHLRTPRSRWTARAAGRGDRAGASGVGLWARHRGLKFPGGRNPLPLEWLPTRALLVAGSSLGTAALVASVVDLALRYRRARGVARQQLKVFGVAAAGVAVTLPAAAALWSARPDARGRSRARAVRPPGRSLRRHPAVPPLRGRHRHQPDAGLWRLERPAHGDVRIERGPHWRRPRSGRAFSDGGGDAPGSRWRSGPCGRASRMSSTVVSVERALRRGPAHRRLSRGPSRRRGRTGGH